MLKQMKIIIFDWRSLLDNCQILKLNCPWDNIAPFTVIREIILTSRSKSFPESKSKVHNNLIYLVSRNKETLLGAIIVPCSLWYILPWYPFSLFLSALNFGIPRSTWPRSFMPGFPRELAHHLLTSRLTSLTCEMGSPVSLSSLFWPNDYWNG